jgi:hypothetical protein
MRIRKERKIVFSFQQAQKSGPTKLADPLLLTELVFGAVDACANYRV